MTAAVVAINGRDCICAGERCTSVSLAGEVKLRIVAGNPALFRSEGYDNVDIGVAIDITDEGRCYIAGLRRAEPQR